MTLFERLTLDAIRAANNALRYIRVQDVDVPRIGMDIDVSV